MKAKLVRKPHPPHIFGSPWSTYFAKYTSMASGQRRVRDWSSRPRRRRHPQAHVRIDDLPTWRRVDSRRDSSSRSRPPPQHTSTSAHSHLSKMEYLYIHPSRYGTSYKIKDPPKLHHNLPAVPDISSLYQPTRSTHEPATRFRTHPIKYATTAYL